MPTLCKGETIAFTSDGAIAYLAQGCAGSLLVVDTAAGEVVSAVVAGGAASLAVTPGPHVLPELPPLGAPPPRAPAGSREVWVVNRLGVFPDGYDDEAGHWTPGTVSIIDPATRAVRASIEVLPLARRMVFRPDGDIAYVMCLGDPFDGTPGLVVVDARAKTVLATLPLGTMPVDLVVSPDGGRLYVLVQYPDADVADIVVIDTGSHTVLHSISIAGGDWRGRFRLSPDGRTGLVGLVDNRRSFRGSVAIVDLVAGRQVANVPDSSFLDSVHLHPGGRLAFGLGRIVSMIDIELRRGAGAIPIRQVLDLAVSPDGERIYALQWSELSVIDARRGRVEATIPLPPGHTDLTAAPDGAFLYAWSLQAPEVDISVLDAHGHPMATVDLPFGPRALAVAPDGSAAYAIGNALVAVIDTAAHRVAAEIRVDYGPIDIAFAPEPAPATRAGDGDDQTRAGGRVQASSP